MGCFATAFPGRRSGIHTGIIVVSGENGRVGGKKGIGVSGWCGIGVSMYQSFANDPIRERPHSLKPPRHDDCTDPPLRETIP